jgi:hypothetical protein
MLDLSYKQADFNPRRVSVPSQDIRFRRLPPVVLAGTRARGANSVPRREARNENMVPMLLAPLNCFLGLEEQNCKLEYIVVLPKGRTTIACLYLMLELYTIAVTVD